MTVHSRKPPEYGDFRGAWHPGGNGHGRRAGKVSAIVDGACPPGRTLEIRELVDAVRALPDVRHDKVAAMRKAIAAGTYVVDVAKIAEKMIDEIR